MTLFTVHPETCNRDGICAAVCPLGIIDWQPASLPEPAADAASLCIRCGHCVAVCPTASLSHRDMPVAACPPLQPELRPSAEQGAFLLHSRRSIRTYRNQAVPRELLAQLIDLARYAPSGINSQGVHWLALGGRDTLDHLAGLVIDWMRQLQTEAPAMARSLHVDRAIRRWEAGIDGIFRGAPALVVACGGKENRMAPTTCTIALTYLELAANALGLGGCWAGYFNAAASSSTPLIQALALPEHMHCLGAMMIGYPKFAYHRLPTREPASITWRL